MNKLPGQLRDLLKLILRRRRNAFRNEDIAILVGGKDSDWGKHLMGARISCIVSYVNRLLQDDDLQLLSDGIGRKTWRVVSYAEYHRAKAEYRLLHIDSASSNAHTAIENVLNNANTPKNMKRQCIAWLELFETDGIKEALPILVEFADELIKSLPKIDAKNKQTKS